MTIGPSSSAAQARSATHLKYLKESIMTPSNCPIVHPTETFLTALGIQKATFQIDYNQVGESVLGDLYPEQIKLERPNRIVETYGTFDENRKALDRANSLGASLSVNLGHEHLSIVACRAPAGAFSSSKTLQMPDTIVYDSPMFETAYWLTHGSDPESRKDLKDRLDDHYHGDPYFDGATLNVELPGYEHNLMHGESGNWTSSLVATPARTPKNRSASEIAKHFPPASRDKARDRQEAIEEAIYYDVSLDQRCATIEEADQMFFKIKESCLTKGFSLEDTLYRCLEWNRKQPIRWTDDTCVSAFYVHEDKKAREDGLPDSRGIKPLFAVRSARIDYFIDQPPPERAWILKQCLPTGKAGMLTARGGTGKSQFALQMAASVASGEDCMGQWVVEQPRKVIYLAAEDDESELHRRVHNVTNAMAKDAKDTEAFHAALRQNLFVKSMVGRDNRMTSIEYGREVTETEYVGRLLHTFAGYGPFGLIIIDPASRFRGGNENAAEDATRFVETLERLATATGATVLVIHHVNKWSGRDGEQVQEAARGSSAFTDGVRWQMNLAGVTTAEAKEFSIPEEERGYYLTATVTKNNYAPPQPKVFLKRGDGGVLSAAQLTSKKAQQNADLSTRVLDHIREEAKRGALYSKSKFEATFGGKDGLFKTGKVAVRNILGELLQAGRVMLHGGKLAMPNNVVPHARVPGA